MLEGWTALGFMAAHTQRARLGLMVGGDPLPRPGHLGQGRDDARRASAAAAPGSGIGAAWNVEESQALGFRFPPLGDRFELLEETLQIAHQMFEGELRLAASAFEGRHSSRPAAQLAAVDLPAARPDHDRRRRRAEDAPPRRAVRRREQRLRRAGAHPSQVAGPQGHCDGVGRQYDEIERTTLRRTSGSAGTGAAADDPGADRRPLRRARATRAPSTSCSASATSGRSSSWSSSASRSIARSETSEPAKVRPTSSATDVRAPRPWPDTPWGYAAVVYLRQ